MRKDFSEDIFGYFNNGLVAVTKGELVVTPVIGAALRRNEALELILDLTSRGRRKDRPDIYPAGTVRSPDEEIEFRHAGGGLCAARGVVWHGASSRSDRAGETDTVDTYSAHSVEVDSQRQAQPSYIVEWVMNLPDGFIWTEPVRIDSVETWTKAVGAADAEVVMASSRTSGGGSRALHVKVSGIDLYLMRTGDRDDDIRKAGQIVYRGCPDQAFRNKVRTCLSFVLGKPLVYLGHTEYCSEWIPTFMRSVDGLSIDGAVFKLHDLPPYPINQPRYANMIDQGHVSALVNALLEKHDDLKFNELAWSYWYAMCAPVHAAAVHFGSLIEQLQNNSRGVIKATRRKLLDDDAWEALNGVISAWLESATLDPDIRKILKGKIAGINQAPQSLVLKRLSETMGLSISEIETKAWKQRNMAAHGGISDNPIELILNSKVLRLLFHRMLAGITYCSDRYIDYYSLGHPVRPLAQGVPGRR